MFLVEGKLQGVIEDETIVVIWFAAIIIEKLEGLKKWERNGEDFIF